ncbi:MAG TPA: hypothetical protein VGE50_12435 [Gammaproteobacteria bacterium]
MLLHTAQQREAKRVRRGKSCYVCRLQRMIAHYWLGKEIGEEFQVLQLRLRNTAHGRILAELIYGQLLISQRRSGAMAALDHAFHAARHLLMPNDYFVLFKRHNLLRKLPLGAEPQKELSLEELLTTAAVIERMTKTPRGEKRKDDGSSL